MGLIQSAINNTIHTATAALALGKDKEPSPEEVAQQKQEATLAKDRDIKKYAEAMAKAQSEQSAKDQQKKQIENIRNSFLNWQSYKV